MNKIDYEPVIGLEVHVQLKTESKAFCGCSTMFGAPPNTQVCPVCLGLPGVLPVLNEKAVLYAISAAIALNCKISDYSKFDRKNYFYPDLPKNFQISQYDKPLSEHGYIDIDTEGRRKRIRIKRIHLEEDAGKLVHAATGCESYVDFNRSGMPLLEVVTEPDFSSPLEAYVYLVTLKQVLQYLDVSDCNMEEGSLRCDANVSLRPKGVKELGVKAELKNMNSFKAVQKALNFEIDRQDKLLKEGKRIIQETRLWDADLECTHSMRSKEEAHDYRYFPEPDLLPLVIRDDILLKAKRGIPELPHERMERFMDKYGIPQYDAQVLTSERKLADYFEEAVRNGGSPKLIANWIMSELLRELNKDGIRADKSVVSPGNFSRLIRKIEDGSITGKMAKGVFEEMYKTGKDPETIIGEKNLVQISSHDELASVIDRVISENPKSVNDYKSGKIPALMHLVGQVMRATSGRANPGVVQELLKELLVPDQQDEEGDT